MRAEFLVIVFIANETLGVLLCCLIKVVRVGVCFQRSSELLFHLPGVFGAIPVRDDLF